jgi:cytochrome c
VQVTTEFIPAGLSPAQAEQARSLAPEASARNIQAFAIIANSDCRACHSEQTRMVGPSFREISDRYRGQADAAERLAQKIIAGGSGVWGELPMPPHPGLTPVEATTLAQYALSIGQADAAPTRVALQGAFSIPTATTPPGGTSTTRVTQSGSYLLRATYTDRGAPGATPLTTSEAVLLRQPRIAPQDADVISEGTTYAPSSGDPGFVVNKSGAHIGFRGIDLTGIDSIAVGVLTRFYTWSHFIGGTVEVRLDSPTGPMLGSPVRVVPPTIPTGPATRGGGQNAPGPNAQGPNAQGPNAQGPTPTGAPGAPAPGTPQPGQGGGQTPGARANNPSVPTFLGANVEKPVSFPVGGITGTRDVYVVFRNENETNSLFLVVGVDFKPASTPASPRP